MKFTSVSCGIMIIIIIILRMLIYVILNPLALNDHMQKIFYIVVAKLLADIYEYHAFGQFKLTLSIKY